MGLYASWHWSTSIFIYFHLASVKQISMLPTFKHVVGVVDLDARTDAIDWI